MHTISNIDLFWNTKIILYNNLPELSQMTAFPNIMHLPLNAR